MSAVQAAVNIELTLRVGEVAPGRVRLENPHDRYILAAPLCRALVLIESNQNGVLHDGETRPGLLRVQSPGEVVTVTRKSRADAVFLSIPGETYRKVVADTGRRAGGRLPSLSATLPQPSMLVEHLCRSLFAASEISQDRRQLFIDGLGQSLLAILLDASERSGSAEAAARAPGLTDAELRLCLDYADARISEKVDLGEWAKVLGIPTGEFARRFHDRMRVAPYTWFMNRRIDRAKQLLRAKNMPVVEVAFEVGFCSQSHFTEAFRRRVGLSPGRWRAQHLAAGI